MSAGDKNNIYTIQIQIKAVVDDVEKRSKEALNKYAGNIPNLPSREDSKNIDKLYKAYDEFMQIQDSIICVICRLDLVTIQMEDIKETKLTRDLSNDIRELTKFKNWVELVLSKFKTYRYDLFELKRSTSDKVKLLQGLLFKDY